MIAGLCITVWAIVNILAWALCKAAARGDEMPFEIGVSGGSRAGIASVGYPLDAPHPPPRAVEAGLAMPGIPALPPPSTSTNIERMETPRGFWHVCQEVAAAGRVAVRTPEHRPNRCRCQARAVLRAPLVHGQFID